MKITNSGYKLLLLLPLLIFLTSVDKCSGAIGLVGGGGDVIISDLVKVAGTRATAQLTVPDDISSDLIGKPGTIFCMDATLSATFDLSLAFECGTITINPGAIEVILHNLWPDWDYLAAVYESEASASVVKATATSEPISNIASINTDLREVRSVAYGNTLNVNCRSGYLNSDDILDFVCGGSRLVGGQIGIWFGTGGLPSDGFSVATISGNSENEQLGLGLYGGDINGDGHDDLVVGDPKYDSKVDVGAVYIWFGPLQFANGDDVSVTTADQTIVGNLNVDRNLGQAVTFFTNATMGMSALLVGVPGGFGSITPCIADQDCGFVRGYQWNAGLGQMVEFSYTNPLFAGNSGVDYKLGQQTVTGDYDADGFDDLFFNENSNGNGPGCHVADLLIGSSITTGGGSPTIDVLHEGTLCLTGMGLFLMQLPQDLNGDGYDDFPVLEAIWSTPTQWRTTVYFGGKVVDPARKLVFEGTDLNLAFILSADINSSGVSKLIEFDLSNTSVFTLGGADGITIGNPLTSFRLSDGVIGSVVDLNGDTYTDFIKGGIADINEDGKMIISY